MLRRNRRSRKTQVAGLIAVSGLVASAMAAVGPPAAAAGPAGIVSAPADDELAIVSDTLVSLTPARFVDTRAGFATFDGQQAGDGKLGPTAEYEIEIAGRGDVPADAAAVVVNVTAVQTEDRGYVTLHPCVTPRPLASSLNYVAGVNVGNEVVAALSPDGTICAFTNRNAHLTIDVVGYVPATGEIAPLVPARLLDTRPGFATIDGLAAGAGRTAIGSTTTVPVAGRGGVATTDVHSVLVNVTAVNADARGFVVAHGCLANTPSTSSLNFIAGVNRGNELLVEVDAAGDICLFTSTDIHLTVDVVGYIPVGSTVATTLPTRLADSRPGRSTDDGVDAGFGKQVGGSEYEIQVTGRGGVPADAKAAVVNVTAVAPESKGWFTVHPCVTPRPLASSLNYVAGVNGGNELIAGLSPGGSLCVYTNTTSHFTVDLVGYLADSAAPMADLAVTKLASADPVNAGDTLTYTVTVTNNGPDDAENVRVTDELPDELTLVSTTGCAADPTGLPLCELGEIANGASKQFTIDVSTASDAESTTLSNTATVASDTADPLGGNNTATVTSALQAVGTIVIEKSTEPAGGTGFSFTDDIAAPNSFALDDGQSETFLDVPVGAYTVTETDPSPVTLVSITCDDGASATPSTGVAATGVASIGLDPGETVTCTYLNNLNLAPTITSDGGGATASVNAAENQAAVTDVQATDDLDAEGAGLTYAISGGADQAAFDIDTNTGVLTFTNPPDFENPTDTGGDNGYDVQVTVTDAGPGPGLTDTQDIAVTVTDVNDAPIITSDGGGATASVNAAENQTAVTTVLATDEDLPAQTLTASITGGADQALFSITPGGVLTFTNPPDLENPLDTGGDSVYDVQVTITDNGAPNLADTQDIAVTVTDINDAPSFTKGPDQTVLEDGGPQTVANWATGISAGEAGQTVTFNVVGNTNAALFSTPPAIDPTGTLTYTPAPDANGTADITIELMDNGGTANGGTDTSPTQTFTINVTAVNDAPAFTKGADETVLEDAGAQTVLGWATAISPGPADEAGQVVTFNVVGNTNPTLFSTPPAIDPTGTLTYTPAPDANGTADITIELMDNGGTANGGIDTSPTQTFTINVTAVNDAPIITSDGGGATASVNAAENQTAVTDVQATDDLDAEGAGLTYTISGGADQAAFDIDTNTGLLTFTNPPDFETPLDAGGDNDYDVQVTVTDAGPGPGLTDTQDITVTVTDVNDAPVITSDGGGATASVNAAENQTAVTTVTATDEDLPAQTLTASITGGADQALFSITPGGVLTFTNPPDFETPLDAGGDNDYDVQVTVTDNGTPNLNDTQDIAVTVTDVEPETPPTAVNDAYGATGNVSLTVPAANGVLLGTGADTGPGLTVTDVQGVAANVGVATDTDATGASGIKGSVTVGTDGSFTYRPPPGYVGNDQFTYEVTNGAGSDTATVTIAITDVIWFVDDTSTGANRGTLADPFTSTTSLNTAQGAAAPAPTDGQTIFVDTGSGTYTDGVVLRSGQKLIGEGSSADIPTAAGIVLAPFSDPLPATGGTAPVLTDSADDGVDLNTNNTVRGVTIGATLGFGLDSEAPAGTLTVSEVAITGLGGGVDISGGAGDPINVVLTDLSATSSTAHGIRLQGTSGTLNVLGTTGTITTTNLPAIDVNASGTDVTFNGAVTANSGAANGINLVNNTGATITLGGQLDIDTTSGIGFNATGGGTIVANGVGSDIDTTAGGTGVNVVNTSIGGTPPTLSGTDLTGSFGLSFQSVSVNGATNAIVLDNAGTGGFTITGTGTDGSGGSLANTTSDAIVLRNGTENVELTNIAVSNSGQHGVVATGSVTNLVVNDSQFTDIGNAAGEEAFSFDNPAGNNIAGQLTLNDVDVTRFFDNGINVFATSDTVNIDVINGSDFVDGADIPAGATMGQAIIVETEGTAGADLNVNGSLFDDVETDAVRFEAGGSGTNNVDVVDNTVTDPGGPDNFPNGGSFQMIVTDAGTLTFDIQGNTQNDLPGDGIIVAATTGGGNISGRIGGPGFGDGNVINGGVDSFGFPVSDGIRVSDVGVDASIAEAMTLLIQNNTINAGGGDDGIQFSVGDSDGTYDVTIRDNTISNTGSEGIRFFFDDDNTQSPDLDLDVVDNDFVSIVDGAIELATRDTATACANVTGNSDGAAGSPGTIEFDERDTSAISVPQADLAAVATANSGANAVLNLSSNPITFGAAPCVPTLPSHS